MPTTNQTISNSFTPWSQSTKSDLILVGGRWVCDPVPTLRAKTFGSPKVRSTKQRIRGWSNSIPWPVVDRLKQVNAYSDQQIEKDYAAIKYYTRESPGQCYNKTEIFDLPPTDGATNNSGTSPDPEAISWCGSRAMLNFLNKVKDQKSQIAVTVHERRQTFDMVGAIAHDLAHLRRRWLRKQPYTVRKSEKQLFQRWLEYRYGWMPLLYDVRGIAEHLASAQVDPTNFPVKAGQSLNYKRKSKSTWNGFAWKGDIQTDVDCKIHSSVGGFVSVEYRMARELARAGLTNPLEVLWEIMPYSFVVDWFVKIGDYCEAMTALQGVSLKSCFASTVWETETRKSVIKQTSPSPSILILPKFSTVTKIRTYSRSGSTPSLMSVDPLSLVNRDFLHQSWKHYVDAIALLKMAFKER